MLAYLRYAGEAAMLEVDTFTESLHPRPPLMVAIHPQRLAAREHASAAMLSSVLDTADGLGSDCPFPNNELSMS